MSEQSGAREATPPERSRLVRVGDLASRMGSLDPRDPIMRRGLHIAIGLVVLLGVGLAIWGALNQFPEIDWRWRPASLALGVVGVGAFLLLDAELWRRLLRALGSELHPLPATTIWLISALGRFVPTSLLTPMIRTAMSEREGVAKRVCLASMVYEVALALSGAMVVGAYFIVDLPELSGERVRFLAIGLPLIAIVVLQPRIFHRLTAAVLSRLGREPIPLALPPARIPVFLGLYALVYALAGISTYALGQSIYPMGADDIVTVLGAFAVGGTLGVIAFMVPGGLGVREAGLAVALSPIMPTAPAVAIAVLSRVVQIAMEVLLATLTQIAVRRRGYPELDTSPAGP
jgi:uncharacterized membrane protein YbhN (UPF0104 family)